VRDDEITDETTALQEEAMTTRESIEAAVAALSQIKEARPRIGFVFAGKDEYESEAWDAIEEIGGKLSVEIYLHHDKPPHVIEVVELRIDGVKVHAQRSRPATSKELESPGSRTYHHEDNFISRTLEGG